MKNKTSIRQEILELYKRHLALMEECDEFVPKHHLFLHLILGMPRLGNPRYYSTWLDEALNKTLKNCCRNVSQATFSVSVLSNMLALTRRRSSGKRKA